MIEAAYTTAVDSKFGVYPLDVRAETRSLELDRMVPDYIRSLPLRSREFEGLLDQPATGRDTAFLPDCDWTGLHSRYRDDEGHQMSVAFTSPIVANDRRLALIQVSFQEEGGGFGFGKICVVRQAGARWSASCQGSWIS